MTPHTVTFGTEPPNIFLPFPTDPLLSGLDITKEVIGLLGLLIHPLFGVDILRR
jgi:hypothetical protein